MRRSTKVKSAAMKAEDVVSETKLRPNLTCMVQGPHDALTVLLGLSFPQWSGL